ARMEAIGAGMAGGELTIDGSVGRDLGLAMSGGRIDVHGNAGDNAGGARPGAARGVTGGEVVVRGNGGAEAGARARRGRLPGAGGGGGSESGLGPNGRAWRTADARVANAAELRGAARPLRGGARVIDAGIDTPGGYGAGRALAEICMGGLADVAYPPVPIGGD